MTWINKKLEAEQCLEYLVCTEALSTSRSHSLRQSQKLEAWCQIREGLEALRNWGFILQTCDCFILAEAGERHGVPQLFAIGSTVGSGGGILFRYVGVK